MHCGSKLTLFLKPMLLKINQLVKEMIAKEFESITEAYLWSLKNLETAYGFTIDHLIVTLKNPLSKWKDDCSKFSFSRPFELIIPIAPYEQFHYDYEKLNNGGVFDKKSGKEWIKDRIEILCPLGEEIEHLKKTVRELDKYVGSHFLKNYNYLNRLLRYPEFGDLPGSLCVRKRSNISSHPETLNQLAILIYKLAKDATNNWVYGVVSVYNPCVETLGLLADRRNGNIRQIPCLAALNFTMTNGYLNLFATWRHQTFDHKAYGNWISLVMLLKLIVDITNELRNDDSFPRKHSRVNVKAGNITSVACRADFVNPESRKAVFNIAKPYLPDIEHI